MGLRRATRVGTAQGAAEDELPRPLLSAVGSVSPHVHRVFYWDSSGRRVASDDPDTDDPDGTAGSNTWRYRFNSMGDIVAVRDPRGCGQNFFYDLAGRILGEQYVSCGEAQTGAAERPVEDVPTDAIGVGQLGATQDVDVRYFYDEVPFWAQGLSELPTTTSYLAGRATGSSDRGQRSAVWYDARGNAVWGARQMAFISDELTLTAGTRPSWDDRPLVTETAPTPGYVDYDDTHTYVRTAEFDHANRGIAIVLPLDPDFDPTAMVSAPEVRGELTYQRRGLPYSASVDIGTTTQVIIESIAYTRDGLPTEVVLGDGTMSRDATVSTTDYDCRRRPERMTTLRDPDSMATTPDLAAVTLVADQELVWDAASNLTDIIDHRTPSEWPAGHQPQTVRSDHDALYRVIQADFEYGGSTTADDPATDWRDEQTRVRTEGADPMDSHPAPMLPSLPDDRVRSLTWSWDWLANTTEWTDDASSFYERSLENIVNGHDIGERPSALRAAWNLPDNPASPVDGGSGWLETEYGAGGNLLTLTARAQCTARTGASMCTLGTSGDPMRDWHELMSCRWRCASEQHYQYRWDELNRLAEARRWDRNDALSGATWVLNVRQRYRYDGANQRTIKQTLDTTTSAERIALYVYPGDFERRGLVRNVSTEYEPAGDGSETQYIVAGARIVWQHNAGDPEQEWTRNRRVLLSVVDLLGTANAAHDLRSGELVETATYYPNGAKETQRAHTLDDHLAASGPDGFSGKEGDDEVGLSYFGERYLVSRTGRWASPDPMQIHASGGGEGLNSFHYVGGNLLQARDALGLDPPNSLEIEGQGRPGAHSSPEVPLGPGRGSVRAHAGVSIRQSGIRMGSEPSFAIEWNGAPRGARIVQTIAIRATGITSDGRRVAINPMPGITDIRLPGSTTSRGQVLQLSPPGGALVRQIDAGHSRSGGHPERVYSSDTSAYVASRDARGLTTADAPNMSFRDPVQVAREHGESTPFERIEIEEVFENHLIVGGREVAVVSWRHVDVQSGSGVSAPTDSADGYLEAPEIRVVNEPVPADLRQAIRAWQRAERSGGTDEVAAQPVQTEAGAE